MAAKKTSFYHTRNKIVPNKELAAEILGIDVSEVEKMDKEGAPVMAERLLRLWDKKIIYVSGWDGWCFSRGVLKYKSQQWRPDNLLKIRDDNEKLFKLESDLKALYSFNGLKKIGLYLFKRKVSKVRNLRIKIVIN